MGASAEERVCVLKFIFQLVVKLDGLKMCQLVQNSTESKTCGTPFTSGTAPSFSW